MTLKTTANIFNVFTINNNIIILYHDSKHSYFTLLSHMCNLCTRKLELAQFDVLL